MIGNSKAQFFSYFLLQMLYLLILKFYNLSAFNTDTVVVVAVVGYVLIPCLTVAKLPFNGNTAPGQKLHGSINRCVANLRISAPDSLEKLFQIYVGIGFKKYINDVVSLDSGFETFFVQLFSEAIFLFSHLHGKHTWVLKKLISPKS